ncbi:MAG TPA: hypothetical protein VFC35_01875 [Gemmatimonadaceae bacterium]|nr:hypothetical protein [Gemmatimonadaceae bacterium]
MKSLRIRTLMVAAAASIPALAFAQTQAPAQVAATATVTPAEVTTPPADTMKSAISKKTLSPFYSSAPKIEIQNIRPTDMRGLNVYESPKEEGVPYTGFKLNWGAGFTQQFQGLDHSNTASPKVVAGVDANKLIQVGHGFNNAEANLYMNAQVAKGIRVALTSYLSTRHHNETWVKDGYFLIDASPINVDLLNNIMKYVTLRVGHFEINYGDAHFRRTDAGNAMFNPLVGNYIMDAFTTEIGAEAYVRKSGFLAMAGMTGGEVRGQIIKPAQRAPTYLGKLGFDKELTPDVRVRLMGSLYQTAKSISNTLYSGDRGGSRYYDVLENTASTETAQAWSGAIQPGLSSKVRALQFNPFVKVGGLEFFGIAEQAKGRNATETADRTWNQYAGEALYRFLADDRVYVAGRYNTAKGRLLNMTNDVSVDRYNVGAGWFITPNVMMKGEWVNQKYNDFPTTDIRNGGKFKGYMIEGVVAF